MFPRFAWFLLACSSLIGCKSPESSISTPASQSAPFSSPQDDLGRKIALSAPARRVVVIGPGAIETIFAFQGEKALVGRDSYADFPPAARKIAVAGDYLGPSAEKCVALHPDLVIVQGETWDVARVENWQKQIGVPVAALIAKDLKSVASDMVKMGAWLGHRTQAQKLAAPLALLRPAKKGKPVAFVEISRSPLSTAGTNTLVDDVLRAGGFSNVTGDVRGYQAFGMESLLVRQPQVYIVPTPLERQEVTRQLQATSALSKLRCVREGHVVAINGDWLLRPGPRLWLGIKALRNSLEMGEKSVSPVNNRRN